MHTRLKYLVSRLSSMNMVSVTAQKGEGGMRPIPPTIIVTGKLLPKYTRIPVKFPWEEFIFSPVQTVQHCTRWK